MADTKESQPKWYTMTPEAIGKELGVDPAKGLSAAEAKARLQKYGPNRLAEKKKKSGLQAFLEQYQDLMQFVLLGAAIVNQIFTGEWGTTMVLIGLTVFNAILGMRGEAKAEASLAALAGTMKSITRVRRDGQAIEIETGRTFVLTMHITDRHCKRINSRDLNKFYCLVRIGHFRFFFGDA